MKVRHFLSKLEHDRLLAAIRAAEEGTSGDIIVVISRREVDDPVAAAHLRFKKLGLDAATSRDNLLIYVAPRSRKFAVLGGAALYEKVGQAWCEELATGLERYFKEDRYTDGLVAAIETAGPVLRLHFPASAPDRTGQSDIIED